MLKAVLDTNVLVETRHAVSLLSSVGVPNQVLWRAGQSYQLFTSHEILEEVRDVLRRPRIQKRVQLTEDGIRTFLSAIRAVADVVEDTALLQVIEDDPDDNFVLACALKAHADYLVSGDIHLKQLGGYKGIRIVSPSEFLAHLGNYKIETRRDGDTERKEGKITNDTNQQIASIIRDIRPFVKFVINLFFPGFLAFWLSDLPCLCASVVFFFLPSYRSEC